MSPATCVGALRCLTERAYQLVIDGVLAYGDTEPIMVDEQGVRALVLRPKERRLEGWFIDAQHRGRDLAPRSMSQAESPVVLGHGGRIEQALAAKGLLLTNAVVDHAVQPKHSSTAFAR